MPQMHDTTSSRALLRPMRAGTYWKNEPTNHKGINFPSTLLSKQYTSDDPRGLLSRYRGISNEARFLFVLWCEA